MNKLELQQELRGQMGDMTEAQLPDTQVTRALAKALREFGRYRKRDTPVMFDISPNVYDYPLPDGVVAVKDFFVYPAYLFWENVDPLMLSLRLPTLTIMGLMTIVGIKPIENWPLDVQIIPPDTTATPPVTTPTLRLLSLPDVPAIMFCFTQTQLTYTDLTDEEQQALLMWAKGDCLEWLGLKRSKPVKRIPTAAGNLLLDDGKELRLEGRELKQEFHAQLGRGATVLDRG